MAATITLAQLNAMQREDFVRCLGDVFEHSPWIAESACAGRPFVSVDALHAHMVAVVEAADNDAQLGLLRVHPELAGKAARAGELTESSTSEQRGAGMNSLDPAQLDEVTRLNAEYRERFGFPFVIAVRDNSREQIFAKWRKRLGNSLADEQATALQQVYLIARLRLDSMLTD